MKNIKKALETVIEIDFESEFFEGFLSHKETEALNTVVTYAVQQFENKEITSKPKAKWLKTDYTLCAFEQCSACGWQGRVCTEFCDKATKKYCPNCGAEMEVNNG